MASWLKWMVGGFCLLGTAVVLAGEATEYTRAAQEIERLAAAAKDENAMPRASDPKVAKLLAGLSDTTLLDHKTYGISDLEDLMSICNEANKLTMSYSLFGLKGMDVRNADPKHVAAQLVPLISRNGIRFQDEVTPLMVFSVHCQAKGIPALTQFVTALKPQEMTDIRRQGLAQYRGGIFQVYAGVLQASVEPALKEAHRVRLLRELADYAPQFTSVLQPQTRAQVVALVREQESKGPRLLFPYFKTIADAMGDPRCEALCAL